jgi:SSS family solute:Na+ symporter
MPNALLFAASDSKLDRLLTMSPVDYVIVAIYFVIVLGIGFYLKKFAGTGEDFFMAGRKMTAWIAGLSFISANLSSLETMGWSAMTYQYGMLGAHAYLISGALPILFLAVVMMPFYYICKTHSVPGYLKLRYGESSRSMAGITFAAMTLLVSGSSMFAMAKILNLLLGWNMNWSILVSSLTVAIYVTLGGLISAVFNEVVQFFLIWLGTLLVPILGLISCGGWNKMMLKIHENVKVIHPALQNADFSCLWHNLGSFGDNPMGIDWFGMLFGQGLALGFAYWCTDFLQVQRVIVAKDLRAAQNGTIIGAALKMCVPLIVILPGLLGLALLSNPDGSPMVLVPETDIRAMSTNHTYNDVLPLLMGKYLGPGLLGLGITAMIAGFMSGMAGNVSAFATVWTYDVYRPLLVKHASDHHYLNVGRWCSILGVLLSIATAYSLFFFSNILEYLQVLVFFFIVPLFGVVIVGMLWKRATPKGGFWGFFLAILFSIGMWVFVHYFPDGYRPQPKIMIGDNAVVSLEKELVPNADKKDGKPAEKVVRVIVEKGSIDVTNVPVPDGAGKVEVTLPTTAAALLTAMGEEHGEAVPVTILAPKVMLEGEKEPSKFGLRGVPMVVKPGVKVEVHDALQHFAPKVLNPAHTKRVARSEKAQPMAVNVYSAFWTLCASILITIVVSLFTKPKPDAELKNLVMGLTPRPDEGPCPWYKKPMLWAAVVFAAIVIVDIIFW